MPMISPSDADRAFMRLALAQARISYEKGSIPVGTVIVRDGAVVADGRNRSQEANDPTSHGETDAVRNLGLQPSYDDLTLYTTLSPCMMCNGTMLFLGIPKVVIGDRETYPGDVAFLLARGMSVTLLDDPECVALMRRFIAERPDLWQRVTAGEK
jgi:cytosine deaminase